MTLVTSHTDGTRDPFRVGQVLVQGFYVCDQCVSGSIGVAYVSEDDLRFGSASASLDLASAGDSLSWLPVQATSKSFPDVPPHIAGPASEAYTCRSVDAFKASILLARAVVEATAKQKGVVKGRLDLKIDAMFERKFLSELVRDSAHEIRHLGNDMAHGDFAIPHQDDESPPTPIEVTAQDADEILALMDMVLDEVFQKPAKVQRLRDARLARNDVRANRS